MSDVYNQEEIDDNHRSPWAPPLEAVLGSHAEHFSRVEGTWTYERGGYYSALRGRNGDN